METFLYKGVTADLYSAVQLNNNNVLFIEAMLKVAADVMGSVKSIDSNSHPPFSRNERWPPLQRYSP